MSSSKIEKMVTSLASLLRHFQYRICQIRGVVRKISSIAKVSSNGIYRDIYCKTNQDEFQYRCSQINEAPSNPLNLLANLGYFQCRWVKSTRFMHFAHPIFSAAFSYSMVILILELESLCNVPVLMMLYSC